MGLDALWYNFGTKVKREISRNIRPSLNRGVLAEQNM